MTTVTFCYYINTEHTMQQSSTPLSGEFLQWASAYIQENEVKIPVTVALVQMRDGRLLMASPLNMSLNSEGLSLK